MKPDGTCFQAALDFLYGRINYEKASGGPPRGRGLKLDRMRALLARLGDPQDQFPAVHIAGTKGKGSCAAMISAVLQSAGYRTALYTSPHLERLEERIQIDGEACSGEELIELVDAVRPAVNSLDEEAERGNELGPPTFFEITTAMAMLYFAQREVEVAVLEVGLGGRLDSTNVCRPVVSVITSISFDHTRQLGDTLAEIAAEKAGIIKPRVPVICGVTALEPRAVITQLAVERAAHVRLLGDDFDFEYYPPEAADITAEKGRLSYRSNDGASASLPDIRLGMLGAHQAANAALAIAAVQQLGLAGWRIGDDAIYTGIATAHCPARLEIVAQQPIVMLDTAHNVASIDAMLAALDESLAAQKRILIFAGTREKDVVGMLRRLLPRFDSIILTKYLDNPRAVPVTVLAESIASITRDEEFGTPAIFCSETPEAAWEQCKSIVSADGLVCITGSFFLAAEMRDLVLSPRPIVSG